MTWILMIYFGSTMTANAGQSGFSTEFASLEACKSAYIQYVKNRPKGAKGTMSGICVRKR